MQNPNCIFCKIAAGNGSARIVMQNEKAIAVLDAFPLTLGHTLVISKLHYEKVQDMAKDDAMAIFEIVWQLVDAVESESDANASTIAIHNGIEAGQEVPHVHVHIVPRKRSDGAGAIHSMFRNRPKLGPQDMDAIAKKIVGNLP
jgi:histidine triad (HIT) family protein